VSQPTEHDARGERPGDPSPIDHDGLGKRLERVEESSAFAERASERLTEQLMAVLTQLDRLDRRLRSLEQRLTRVEADDAGPGAGAPGESDA
jgi:uncharacterized coiled-coil protein SlyX